MKRTALTLCLSGLGAMLLSGCSANFQPSPLKDDPDATQTPIGEVQGSVHGGQAPVTGAQIYLFAAGTGGYGTASKSLITSGKTGVACNTSGTLNGDCYVKTDASGNFTLSGDYTCTAGTQVYMVAVGGNPGQTGTVNNTAIVQMAGLGECPASGTMAQLVPYLVINEITTVSFAYAMGGFGTDAYHIASSGTPLALTGIENAMRNSYNIVGLGWGGALPVANQNQNSVAPQLKINTLADIMATCVNTTSATSTACTNLFNNARNSAGTRPADEATALFNIVHNPDASTAGLWARLPAQPVFSPTLTAQPADWTLPVVFKNVVSSQPGNIAFDSFGNAWISDRTNNAVVKVNPQGGVASFNANGQAGKIYDVAVDPGNMVWATDYSNHRIYKFDTSGNLAATITPPTLNQPAGIAFDRNGNAHVIDVGNNQIFKYSSSGTQLASTTLSSSMGDPDALAVDTSGNIWVPGYGASSDGINELVPLPNQSFASTIYTNWTVNFVYNQGFAGNYSHGIAIDSSGTPWVANMQGDERNEIASIAIQDINYILVDYGDHVTSANQCTALNAPVSLAIDGGNTLWAANSGAATVSTCSNSGGQGTAVTTLSTGAGGSALAAAPDSAGNLWTANSDGTVTQLLGAATPTTTPVYPGNFGTEP